MFARHRLTFFRLRRLTGMTRSAIVPLSEQSIAKRSTSIDVPHFTGGSWKTANPLGVKT